MRPSLAPVCLAAILAGCATPQVTPKPANPIAKSVEQPFRDVSVIRDQLPQILITAAAQPYATPAACADLLNDLEALETALGPDVDQSGDARSAWVQDALGGAVGGLVGLPFRGVVRRISGAQQRDATIQKAVLAGMVRRGYLRGLRPTLCREAVSAS